MTDRPTDHVDDQRRNVIRSLEHEMAALSATMPLQLPYLCRCLPESVRQVLLGNGNLVEAGRSRLTCVCVVWYTQRVKQAA